MNKNRFEHQSPPVESNHAMHELCQKMSDVEDTNRRNVSCIEIDYKELVKSTVIKTNRLNFDYDIAKKLAYNYHIVCMSHFGT